MLNQQWNKQKGARHYCHAPYILYVYVNLFATEIGRDFSPRLRFPLHKMKVAGVVHP
jgi:hypothetical protein